MVRHTAFKTKKSLHIYLADAAPRHLYYSSAYYRDPGNRNMREKGWLGADLVFDLDADHLKDAENLTFPQMLAQVKEEYEKLLDFITTDFGIPQEKQQMTFSGGRGYHLHVHDPRVFSLGSPERREIVDYITGKGFEVEAFLKPVATPVSESGPYLKLGSYKKLRGGRGWGKRVHTGIVKLLDPLEEMDEKARINYLSELKGVGKKKAGQTLKLLFSGEEGERGIDRIRRGEGFAIDRLSTILTPVIRTISVELGGETDEPVTGDVNRLIRAPGSLHGKSGFKVTTIPDLEALKEFDPLRDTLAFAWDEQVEVLPLRSSTFYLKGEEFTLEPGEPQELPEAAAVFALGTKMAELEEVVNRGHPETA